MDGDRVDSALTPTRDGLFVGAGVTYAQRCGAGTGPPGGRQDREYGSDR